MMRLTDILRVERVSTGLAAPNKASALRALARLIADDEVTTPPLDEETVARVLEEREALGSTGVGSGVAIPHGRLAGLDHFVAALAVGRDGIEFDAVDGAPVKIFFAVIGPSKAAGEHLKCLARIGRLLRDDAVRQQILGAKNAERVLEIVRAADG